MSGREGGEESSVAYRRESDEEHKEPRFELPLPPGRKTLDFVPQVEPETD